MTPHEGPSLALGKETGKLPGYSELAAKDDLGHQLRQAGTVFALAQQQLEALHQQLAELDALCSGLLSGSSSIQSPLQEVQVATARTDQRLDHALKTSEHLQYLVAGIRREAVAEATGAYARENEILREELAEVKKVMITMVPVHSIPVPEDDDLELESVVPSERAEGPANTGTRDKSMSCSSSVLSCCVPVSLNDSSDLEWPEPLMDEFEMLSLRQGNPKLAPPRSWLPHLETSPSESDQALSPARARVPSLAAAALRLLLARWESPLQSFLYPSQTARVCLAARPPARRCLLDAALVELIVEEGTAEDVLAYFLNATQNYKGLSQLVRTTDRPSECVSDWPMVRAHRCLVKTVSSRFHRSPRLVVQFLRHLITTCWHEQLEVKRAAFSVLQTIAGTGGEALGQLVAKSMLPFLDARRSVQNRSFALDVLGHCALSSMASGAFGERLTTALLGAARWPEERLSTRAVEILQSAFQGRLPESASGDSRRALRQSQST